MPSHAPTNQQNQPTNLPMPRHHRHTSTPPHHHCSALLCAGPQRNALPPGARAGGGRRLPAPLPAGEGRRRAGGWAALGAMPGTACMRGALPLAAPQPACLCVRRPCRSCLPHPTLPTPQERLERRKVHEQLQVLRGNIRVCCRVRPLQAPAPGQAQAAQQEAVSYPYPGSLCLASERRAQEFEFDSVFSGEASQVSWLGLREAWWAWAVHMHMHGWTEHLVAGVCSLARAPAPVRVAPPLPPHPAATAPAPYAFPPAGGRV